MTVEWLASGSWSWLVIALICLVLSALGTVAEAVMEAAGARFRAHVQDKGGPPDPILQLLHKPDYYLSSAVVISRVALIVGTVLATALGLSAFMPEVALPTTMLVVSAIVIIFGEIVPRTLASQDLVLTARLVARPLRIVAWFLTPALWLLGLLTNSFARLLGLRPMASAPLVTESELMGLLDIGRQEGLIEEGEQEMIKGIFDLEDTLAREVMVPRINIKGISTDASVDQVVELMIGTGFSRIPLYENDLDHVVGILYVKDMLRALQAMLRGAAPPDLRELSRPACFVPETKKVDALLHELQNLRVHLAIVVDEYGGTAGLVTIEDLLEEIVGDIRDEFDTEETAEVDQISPDEAIMSGRASVFELQEIFGYDVSDVGSDSVGGFILDRLGHVPRDAESVEVGPLRLTVLDVTGHQIRRVRVERLSS